ncbi:hypothetical protein JCM11251_005473 [Rhodosporidiobolus azoricus]
MSKYASLPDIDTGADVFETPDVPAEHSYSRDSDSDDDYLPRSGSPTATRRGGVAGKQSGSASENIVDERIDPQEARKRFGAASLAAREMEARRAEEHGPRRAARRTLPSAAVYSAGEAVDEREKETPLERLRRLRLEVTELEEEVRRNEAERAALPPPETAPAGEGEQGRKGKKREVSPAVILQQLQLLRGDLNGLEPSVEGDLEGDGEKELGAGEGEAGQIAQKAKASSGLLARLGLAGQTEPSPAPLAAPSAPGEARYTSAATGETKEGELEKRLAELEKIVGASEAEVGDTHPLPPPLTSTLSRLDHLLTLLTQPRHLDSISRRVKVLVSDLERIHESRRKLGDSRPLNVALSGGMTLTTGGAEGKPLPLALGASISPGAGGAGSGGDAQLPPDALQKMDALFALLPRLDPLLPLAPRLLARLQSLSSLHASAASFGETLTTLKDEVDRLGEGEKGLKEVLDGLEESVKGNEELVKGNLEALGKRVEEVGRRLDAFQQHGK